ncbi:uncharacterized protein I206_106244 [Kwoniella pini CBS 10737]|uniref:SET domain-containing protein n=1 Tax=Kwoniella pini CBS 10737 TaxID=1296096 RepID=A0A1B9I1G9_9TREE|nr:uncharacterized protein I206_05070 [Kwoniella pini CBS 10737]OCF49377.1 hypothetical protein I206_05070 [Kwoniella pini CBS 10737]
MSSFKDLQSSRKARQGRSVVGSITKNVNQLENSSTTTKDDSMTKHRNLSNTSLDIDSHRLFGKHLDQAGLEVHKLPGRGRGLIAKKSIKPGTVIFKIQPIISTLQNQYFQTICHGCFLTLEEKNIYQSKNEKEMLDNNGKLKLNRCSKCKVLHYCSKECQISDWSLHKYECLALQKFKKMYYKAYPTKIKNDEDLTWTEKSSIETVRALSRIIFKRKEEREKNNNLRGKDGEWWESINLLESHLNILNENDKLKLTQQAQHLKFYLGASIPSSSFNSEDELYPVDMKEFGFNNLKEIMDFCSSFHVNSFTLSSPSLSPIGVSNSPLMALSNHSCDPNAIVVFPNGGKYMELIAIKDISPDEEVLTSYIDISSPYHIRQAELLERYRFKCDCVLCEKSNGDEGWVDPRWCVKHIGCKGKGKMPGEL